MTLRRTFLKTATGSGALAALGDLGFLAGLPSVSAEEAKLPSNQVRFDPEIEPLVRLLEDTPRERVLEEFASRVKSGLSYREVLTALLLAGVRSVQPRPVGFKFHAVLVVNSAHIASLASPDSERWLPIFWALDQFKSSQAANVKEGNWRMGPVAESAVPPSHRAKQMFIDAMDNWDESAADTAIVGLAAARKVLGYLKQDGSAKTFADAARRLIFLKGSNSHDYKFSAAVLEDYGRLGQPWRDRLLASSVFYLRGSGDADNELVKRTRAAIRA